MKRDQHSIQSLTFYHNSPIFYEKSPIVSYEPHIPSKEISKETNILS